MLTPGHRRIVFAQEDGHTLPVMLDNLGYNPQQEDISRPEGYYAFHWLQTAQGAGMIEFDNKKHALTPGSGVLLLPGTPHRYESVSSQPWETYYLTFAGGSAGQILESLGMLDNALYRWEQESPLTLMLKDMLDRYDLDSDILGIGASTEAYHFLLTLNKYGQWHKSSAISRNVDKLQPLLKWMDTVFADPDIGLDDMAARLEVSGRHLGSLFLQTFGLSPYAYLLRLRIRKSKELLVTRSDLTVKAISQLVGFRDVSHFVATFRKQATVTPEQFRRLH
ncbi:AraC family transcriptional regulator [Paenibacillus sp. NFR01]|uniref:AraC family transcriptional regulator n=1 Tax=Paenibacillus sp. NFR01 TaxID=1566279 RepID=UPI0008AD4124|nr:AraC family transcriptional regulator [Paenibacillus sp. NFR01]SEU02568.1 AraC-like ligand binding domain-containing protein [Paenibacillus sp. NFR01]